MIEGCATLPNVLGLAYSYSAARSVCYGGPATINTLPLRTFLVSAEKAVVRLKKLVDPQNQIPLPPAQFALALLGRPSPKVLHAVGGALKIPDKDLEAEIVQAATILDALFKGGLNTFRLLLPPPDVSEHQWVKNCSHLTQSGVFSGHQGIPEGLPRLIQGLMKFITLPFPLGTPIVTDSFEVRDGFTHVSIPDSLGGDLKAWAEGKGEPDSIRVHLSAGLLNPLSRPPWVGLLGVTGIDGIRDWMEKVHRVKVVHHQMLGAFGGSTPSPVEEAAYLILAVSLARVRSPIDSKPGV